MWYIMTLVWFGSLAVVTHGQMCCTNCINTCISTGISGGNCLATLCASPCSSTACYAGQYKPYPACACTNCPIGKYSTSYTQDGDCTYCTGSGLGGKSFCGIGRQPNTYCASGMNIQDDTCVVCPAGMEKTSASIQSCTKCNTGFYKINPGVEACVACPSLGSKYVFAPWGNTSATTFGCPW